MSTKSSIFLTNDQEHCYVDTTDNTIVLEMDRENIKIIHLDDDDLIVEIKPGCELYDLINSIKQP